MLNEIFLIIGICLWYFSGVVCIFIIFLMLFKLPNRTYLPIKFVLAVFGPILVLVLFVVATVDLIKQDW